MRTDDTIAMRATTLLQIKSNGANVTRVTSPAQQLNGRLHIDNGDQAIVMRAAIAIATPQKRLRIDGNDTITMRATTPAQ